MLTRSVRYESLQDAPVIISGGATGIGRVLVQSFALQGARVGFVDCLTEPGIALAGTLADAGHQVAFKACDVTNTDHYRNALGELADCHGPCRILVNNAANDRRHALDTVSPDQLTSALAVNLGHAFFASQFVIPGMIRTGSGCIINLGSISWMQKPRHMAMYAAAKAGVHGLTRALASDYGSHGIRANTIVPGWVMTAKQLELHVDTAADRQIDDAQSLPGRVEPEDIAAMALFLASDQARMCTGQNFIVDAGWV
ncbi:MAG: SDR family NAD(P)-dependent oxidoreductase [Rhodobacteraceae bacterium]|nr:SDR family NAD(P)-dependent oxidoreductase [Paracoccaceae bacterium]